MLPQGVRNPHMRCFHPFSCACHAHAHNTQVDALSTSTIISQTHICHENGLADGQVAVGGSHVERGGATAEVPGIHTLIDACYCQTGPVAGQCTAEWQKEELLVADALVSMLHFRRVVLSMCWRFCGCIYV